MDKILIFTGKQAHPLIIEALASTKRSVIEKYEIHVEMIDVSVAAFITPRKILARKKEISEFQPDLILVPGLCKKDFKTVEEEIGFKIRKGTDNAGQLPDLLEQLDSLAPLLSTKRSADRFLGFKYRDKTLVTLKKRLDDQTLLSTPRNFITASGLTIGLDFPIRIFSEIVDASIKPLSRIVEEARYFKNLGADVIDFGCVAGTKRPENVENGVKAVIKETKIPVSVDSLDPAEIKAGVEAGAEIVVSIDHGNKSLISQLHGELVLVLLPTNVIKGHFPNDIFERVNSLLELEIEVRDKGFSKILADLILEAPIVPGFSKSLTSFMEYRKKSSTPMFAGTGNVTEFLEADSGGVNALLAVLSQELGIAGLLTTEEAPFTFNSTSELVNSAWMVYSALINQHVPKKLGINALYGKSSKRNRTVLRKPVNLEIISPESIDTKIHLDPKGCFEVQIDRYRGLILLHHVKKKEMIKTYAAESALPLLRKITSENLVSDHFHAAYLGKELMKAEICLKIGRTYIQDTPFSTAANPVGEQ